MKTYERPLNRVIFWMFILILVLMFWPREISLADEPDVVIKTHVIYVDREPEVEEVEVIEEIVEEPIPLRYGFTDDDIYLMTVLLCGSKHVDGDGEYDFDFGNQDNHEQISLVLSVVMNRVMSDRYPNTVSEVIWARNQFHPMDRWRDGLPQVKQESYDIVKAWCDRYDSHDLSVMSIPETHLYFGGNGVINRSRERWQ